MEDWFNTRYNREELAQIVRDHPNWNGQELAPGLGRAALAAMLEDMDLQETTA